MLRPEHYRKLKEEYTISKAQYLEHQILLDEIERRESSQLLPLKSERFLKQELAVQELRKRYKRFLRISLHACLRGDD